MDLHPFLDILCFCTAQNFLSRKRYLGKNTVNCHDFICCLFKGSVQSVQFSCSVVSYSLQPHGLQHARLPCPSPAPGAYSNSSPSCQWCHPIISSTVVPFSSHLQYFPASGSFPMSQLFAWGGQSIGVSASASVLPMNIQDWFFLGWTGLIFLQSKGLARVFSNATVQKCHARYWMLGAGALGWPRGMEWGGRREEGSGWGTHVYLWRIHFDIWQN